VCKTFRTLWYNETLRHIILLIKQYRKYELSEMRTLFFDNISMHCNFHNIENNNLNSMLKKLISHSMREHLVHLAPYISSQLANYDNILQIFIAEKVDRYDFKTKTFIIIVSHYFMRQQRTFRMSFHRNWRIPFQRFLAPFLHSWLRFERVAVEN
jgi:hypothetical protein